MNLVYTYQRIMDAAHTLDAAITGVIVNDCEAIEPRRVEILEVAANMAGIARDRRDALCPEAADETVVIKKGTIK